MARFARGTALYLASVLTGSSLGVALVGSIVMALISPSPNVLRPLNVVSTVLERGIV